MDFLYIFMNHICPSFGALIALLMFASPMKAVLRANKEKSLGVSLSWPSRLGQMQTMVRESIKRSSNTWIREPCDSQQLGLGPTPPDLDYSASSQTAKQQQECHS